MVNIKTKGAQAASAAWDAAIPRVGPAYKAGIERTTGWKEAAIAGEENYGAGVQRAVAERSRAAGIEAISETKWKTGATKLGAERIGRGMEEAKQEYATNITKVIGVLESVDLPARTQDAATNITNRSIPGAVALQEAKRRGDFR